METFSLISELFIRKEECDDIILIVVQVFKIANGDKGPPPIRLQAIPLFVLVFTCCAFLWKLLLLHYKASTEVQDNNGNTPLHLACTYGHEDVSGASCSQSGCLYPF